MRRRALGLLGLLTALVGAVFTLQGFGVLGGSFMSGSATWAVIGLAMIVAGVTAYGFSSRTR
jgi:hypothetical protein